MYRDSEPSLTDQKNVKEYIFVSFFFKKKKLDKFYVRVLNSPNLKSWHHYISQV